MRTIAYDSLAPSGRVTDANWTLEDATARMMQIAPSCSACILSKCPQATKQPDLSMPVFFVAIGFILL